MIHSMCDTPQRPIHGNSTKPGQVGLMRLLAQRASLGLILALLPGCAASRSQIARSLMADRGMPTRSAEAQSEYTVSCPDALDLQICAKPGLSGRQEIG